jgi:hypothetical protein
MFTTGFAIFLAMVFIFIKLPRRLMLRLLRYDAALDIGVTLLVLVIHFGTFSGVMAATFAGLLTSVGTSLAKRAFGYIKGDQYFPGYVRLEV